MEKVRRPDRRIERTKRLLRDALISLISERGYPAITVQDITDRADVSRTTFYLHYRDKDELLHSSLSEMYGQFLKHMPRLSRDLMMRHPEQIVEALRITDDFDHAGEYAEFYRTMFSERGSAAFVNHLLNTLTHMMETHFITPLAGDKAQIPVPIIAAFLAGAQVNVIRWWLNGHQADYTPQQMADMVLMLSMNGAAPAMDADTFSDRVGEVKNAEGD